MGFQVFLAELWIPNPRIPDFITKISRISESELPYMHYLAINFNLFFSTSFPPQFIHMIEMEADDSQERFIKKKCLPGLTVCALVCCETQEQISVVYE